MDTTEALLQAIGALERMDQLKDLLAHRNGLLNCRAGKLLKKGKPFIVVANDESYFTSVYLVIRESEKAKGTWTEECERCFLYATKYDESGQFPSPTPELHAVMVDQREKCEMRDEIKRLREENEELKATIWRGAELTRRIVEEPENSRQWLIRHGATVNNTPGECQNGD